VCVCVCVYVCVYICPGFELRVQGAGFYVLLLVGPGTRGPDSRPAVGFRISGLGFRLLAFAEVSCVYLLLSV
jgi:hypothetical protein